MKRLLLFFLQVLVPVVAMEEKEGVSIKNSSDKEKQDRKIVEMISLMQAFMSTNGISAETDEESGTIYLKYKHFQNDAIIYCLSLDKARKKLKEYLSSTKSDCPILVNYCADHPLYLQYRRSINNTNLHYFQQDTLLVLYTTCLVRWNSFMIAEPQVLGKENDYMKLDKAAEQTRQSLFQCELTIQEIVKRYSERYKPSSMPEVTYIVDEYLKAFHLISFNRMAWRAAFMYATIEQEINAAAQLSLQIWSNKPESIVHARELAIRSFEYEVQKQEDNMLSRIEF